MRLIVSQRSSFKIILSLLIILLFTFSLDVFSHQRSESYSKWSVEEDESDTLVNVAFTIRLSNLNKLEGPLVGEWEDRISAYIISSFTTDSDCLQEGKHRVMTSRADDIFRVSWTLSCNQILEEIKTNVFFDRDPTHSHIARYIYDSNLSTEKLFTTQTKTWNLKDIYSSKESSVNSSFKEYVLLGIKHISTGYDHLAFLFGLLLLNQRLKRLVLAITGFTLGHSLTLSLAVLDLVRPVNSFIEALIGFSIALLGLEFLIRHSKSNSTYVKNISYLLFFLFLLYFIFSEGSNSLGLLGLLVFSFCYLMLVSKNLSSFFSLFIASIFGLIHGFGFGGFLFEVGFSEDNILKTLFGFNLGVEIGQLMAMSLFILIIFGISKLDIKNKEYINPLLATFLVTLGTYWFVYRVI
jgi:hydrogenase/urease accessory protein HupE